MLASSDTSSERSRILFKEALETEFKGAVYHPQFMKFDLDLEIAPQQQREDSDVIEGDGKFRNSYLTHYNFTSTFLEKKPYNFSLFVDQQRNIENNDFFERQIIESKSFGANANLQNKHIPINITYNNSKRDVDRSIRTDQYFEGETLSFRANSDTEFLGQTNFDYTFNEFLRSETGTDDQRGRSDQIILFNTRYFGANHDKNLTSQLNYRDLRGTRSSRDLTFNESLRVDHTDNLKTSYRYNISDRSVEDIDSSEQSAQMSLTHQLFESLETSFNLSGEYLNTTNFDEKSAIVSLTENYRKKIGPSLLRLGIGYGYEKDKRESSSITANIVSEQHALLDASIVTLDKADVDIASIVVTDSAGTTIYTVNTDYQVVELSGGRVEIRRVVSGSITNGQNVLVDYLSTSNPSLTFLRTQSDYRLSLGFWEEDLKFYYTLRSQRYPQIKGAGSNILETVDDTVLGVRWRKRDARVKVEYQDYASDLTPYRALRLYEDTGFSISPRGRVLLHASQIFMNFEDEKRKLYELRGDYSLRLSPSAVFKIENGYRWHTGQDLDLKSLTSKLTYRLHLGKAFFETGYEYQNEQSLGEDRKNHFLFTNFKREF